MDIVGVDRFIVERTTRVLRSKQSELRRLDVFDERFYPPRDLDPETTARYFIVMVSMDHRLSRPGRPYRACLEDGCYEGADLLYRLGVRRLIEDVDFFTPEHLASIAIDEVKDTFSYGEISPPDIDIRTMLLRDLGFKLIKLYDSSVLKLIRESGNRIRGGFHGEGLVEKLRVFRAFEDPVEKKSMLFTKFMITRGLFNPVDELDVAVDNHLSRIAYRLGLVMVSGSLWSKIRGGIEVEYEEDVLLRLTIRRAYRYISTSSGLKPVIIDDYFWNMGRSICLRDTMPLCDKCLFRGFCRARRNNVFMVKEHVYYNTWYY